ncbi:ATP-dependent zinc metalloprotease FtsH [Patescibacteria group bacterium]|nr:ATP-dependent zinc metalloprotease FtsH [Patescibacteria group bacterium]
METSSKTPKQSTKKSQEKDQSGRAPQERKIEINMNMSQMMNRGLLFLFVALLFLPFLYSTFVGKPEEKIALSQMVEDIRAEKVDKLEVAGSDVKVFYKDSTVKTTRKEDGQQLVDVLSKSNIDLAAAQVEVKNLSVQEIIISLIVNILPIVVMAILFLFLFRQARGAQDGIMGIGRSKAKLFVKGKQDTKFADVGGMDEAKRELEEVVDFLKNPKKYKKVGARTPKGVLMVGPSGTGKTLLARAVAGEANVQFLSMAGSEFMEMLVGVGASRVRDLFLTAKKLAPSIIFIDEIDAIGRIRGFGSMGGHDEREQTLNQILVEMDGFTPNDNVIVIAATNRGDMLDPALIRPGRFDRRVQVSLPDLEERKFILNIHAKGKSFEPNLNWEKVAKRTVGFSGADLENMLNEAAIGVARDNRTEITAADIEEASLKVKLGPSKKRLHDEEERKMTAYHEAGHALVAHYSKYSDPVHRISIVSRGMALGFTLTPPEKDKVQVTKSELIDQMAVLLGGRAAEKIIFNELTAGASSDIERATRIARAMVMDFGMSDLGAVAMSPQYEGSNYARAYAEPTKISDKLQEKVDAEVAKLILQGENRAKDLLTEHKDKLDKVSQRLLEIETIDSDEFVELMGVPKAK